MARRRLDPVNFEDRYGLKRGLGYREQIMGLLAHDELSWDLWVELPDLIQSGKVLVRMSLRNEDYSIEWGLKEDEWGLVGLWTLIASGITVTEARLEDLPLEDQLPFDPLTAALVSGQVLEALKILQDEVTWSYRASLREPSRIPTGQFGMISGLKGRGGWIEDLPEDRREHLEAAVRSLTKAEKPVADRVPVALSSFFLIATFVSAFLAPGAFAALLGLTIGTGGVTLGDLLARPKADNEEAERYRRLWEGE